jgi:hypothetical protein
MLAAVFFMQPLGQLTATAIGWGALASIFPSQHLDKLPLDGELLSNKQQYDIISAIDTYVSFFRPFTLQFDRKRNP